jgi:hypothetical protein
VRGHQLQMSGEHASAAAQHAGGLGMLLVCLPLGGFDVGNAETAGRSVQQSRAEVVFERGYLLNRRDFRDVEVFHSTRKSFELATFVKTAKRVRLMIFTVVSHWYLYPSMPGDYQVMQDGFVCGIVVYLDPAGIDPEGWYARSR